MSNDKNLILSVENISLAFPRRVVTNTTLRDVTINALQFKKKPVKDAHLVLEDISFKIHAGERVGLIAVNGAGKSTLCRCISGFYTPLEGKIIRNGKIRALFEPSLAFYPELSGRENLNVLAELFFDLNKEERLKLVNECILFSELNESIDEPVKIYSKGMLLRLTLSLLTSRPTDLLILDEVFDGADEFFRAKLAERLQKLITDSKALLLVSHFESQILSFCNRVIVLDQGQIIYDGNPINAFVVYRKINEDKKN